MRYVEIMVMYWDGIIVDILQSRPEIPVLMVNNMVINGVIIP